MANIYCSFFIENVLKRSDKHSDHELLDIKVSICSSISSE